MRGAGALLAVSALSAPVAFAQGSATEVAAWLAGTFDSKDQAAADPAYETMRIVTVAVPKSRLAGGVPVLYREQAPGEKPDKPSAALFCRIEEAGGRVLVRPFEPKDVAAVRGKWRDPSALALFGPNDVRERAGCTVFLRKTGDHYEGSTEGTSCAGRNGARYATSIVQLWPNLLVSLDRGFDDRGLLLQGPKLGKPGVRFVKRSDAAPPDDGLAAKLAGEGQEKRKEGKPEKETFSLEGEEGTARVAAAEPTSAQAPPSSKGGMRAAGGAPAVASGAVPAPGASPFLPSKKIGLSLPGVGQLRNLSEDDLRGMAGAALATATFRGAVYSGLSLKSLLVSSGIETEGMEARRVLAPAVLIVTGRDGYSAVFSLEEILSGPVVPLLAFEKDGKPLPEDGGPFKIVDAASPTRSVWGVVSLEVRYLGTNPKDEPAR